MNFKLKILIGVGIVILISLMINSLMINSSGSMKLTSLNSISLNLSTTTHKILQKTAQEVADSHEYKLHKFDCTDFSEELVGRLKHLGFDAYCVFGRAKHLNYPFHTWTEVNINGTLIQIESTTGKIISEQIYKENYRVIKRGGKCL